MGAVEHPPAVPAEQFRPVAGREQSNDGSLRNSFGGIGRKPDCSRPGSGELRVGLHQLPVLEILLRRCRIGDAMPHVRLAYKAGGGEIGRASPYLGRIGTAPEADDELVMRDLGPGSAKGGLLVVDGNARRLHGSFVGLSWCVARIVISDLDVNATVDGALKLVEDRRICEFVSRDAKAVAGRSPPDVSQACFEQAAREPNNLGVRRIVDVLGRSISKLLGELLARDSTAIEPNAMACAFFPLFLRLDLEPQLVLRVAGECAGLAVHRQDAKSIGRVRHRAVVAPQETLDRKVLGLEAL